MDDLDIPTDLIYSPKPRFPHKTNLDWKSKTSATTRITDMIPSLIAVLGQLYNYNNSSNNYYC